MKTLTSIIALLSFILLGSSFVSAQNTSNADLQQLREERTVTIFKQQNKHDIAKQKEMGEVYTSNVEKADLQNKRREIQVVNDPTFPKLIETNNPQQGSWEYAQAKKAWIEANSAKYAEMMKQASSN